MSFGIQKSAKLTIKRGKHVFTGPTVTVSDEILEWSCDETCGGVDQAHGKYIITEEIFI